jgi:hypothetical protein
MDKMKKQSTIFERSVTKNNNQLEETKADESFSKS